MEFDLETGRIRFRKASTTPAAPWEGVLDAVDALGSPLEAADLFIHGTTLGLNAVRRAPRHGDHHERRDAGHRILGLIESGQVRPLIGLVKPAAELPQALQLLADGRTTGKTVVTWGDRPG